MYILITLHASAPQVIFVRSGDVKTRVIIYHSMATWPDFAQNLLLGQIPQSPLLIGSP
jgi:predicted nuclease of predicted toxin-antitoxin system